MPGEADEDNNFIDGRPGTVCGNVSDDVGLYISSVEIRLYLDVNNNDSLDPGDILTATTYTDGDTGDYIFEDYTPGEYVIVEIQPANYGNVSDYDHTTTAPDTDGDDSADGWDNQIPVTLYPAEIDCGNDFIEDPVPGAISGEVLDEANVPMVNVVITLYHDTNANGVADGSPMATTTTNGSGQYSFTGVEPGFYVVIETTPAGYSSISDYDHTTAAPDTDGNDSGQGADDDIPVKVLPGESDEDNNFMNGTPGLICGTVRTDTNLPIGGITIRLFDDVNNNDSMDIADLEIAVTTSSAVDGNYCFVNIAPGEYVVVEEHPANYNSVLDHDVSTGAFDPDGTASANDPDNEIAVTLAPNELDSDNNFVEDPLTGVISGNVLDDAGSGMAGVTVTLFGDTNGDGQADGSALATTTTVTGGAYSFAGLEPAAYVVVETSPIYYLDMSDYDHTTVSPDTDGDDTAQGPDNDIPVVLLPGETDSDNIFVNGRPGNICGNVSDNTGQPISSVVITLYMTLITMTHWIWLTRSWLIVFTDGDTGDYCFEDITPGEYIVIETQPANFYSISDYDTSTLAPDTDGDDQADGPDDEIPVTLLPGEIDLDNDYVDAPYSGYINGYVLNEVATPISNVKIYLYADTNDDGVADGMPLDSVFTNVFGYYNISGVLPGTYVLVEVNPLYHSDIFDYDTSTFALDLDGDDSGVGPNNTIPVEIMPAEVDSDNNFTDGRPGSICGFVNDDLGVPMSSMEVQLYEDENGNGIMDPEDDMIRFVMTSGGTGEYCFDDVVPGMYIINEVQLPGYGDASDVDDTPDPDGDDSADGPDNNIPVEVGAERT